MNKDLLYSALVALLVTGTTLGIYSWFQNDSRTVKIEHINGSPSKSVAWTVGEDGEVVPLDFTRIAGQVVNAVVHIKSTQTFSGRQQDPNAFRQLPDPFREFFGNPEDSPFFRFENPRGNGPQVRVGTGSGVIINEGGYIVTNNHVVADAEDLEVTLYDNRTFKATVVGTDPNTDLALIQIKAKGLPTLPLVNSDEVKLGEWVLAVGNPMGLNSTVTAGIVSAKARNINILREQYAVESFIQTDAAINPGNSGGALVNLQGGLIGINTAIASPTGAYAGYGFAVPANIVSKVVEDLLQYGVVQRGVLGVMIRSVDGALAKEKGLDVTQGAYVDSLMENSAAAAAGIKAGDVVLEVEGRPIQSSPELQEMIARYRPGDKVAVKVDRQGKTKSFEVVLNNRQGSTAMVEKPEQKGTLGMLGAEFETLSADAARKLDIDGGVKVAKLYSGKLRRYTDMREGFIITKVDGRNVASVEDFTKALEGKSGGVMLEGVYEDIPGTHYYAFGMQ
ncbi:MAG: Do family serine endopeptidase [Lewinellaceae bacterium]|nr:Do family serine endopeptidase [Lewinellaceae bacterium]